MSWRSEGWRPARWAAISVKHYTHKNMMDCTGREVFEAGADALLTSLLSSGIIKIESLEALNKYGDVKGSAK